MTRMIPPQIPSDAPPGERALFAALAAAPGTQDWIALHSLRLSQHPTQQRGEIDFVVIVPEGGIAVIEVKSHRSVRRDPAGLWHLGSASPTERSPFAQADDAKFALEEFLTAHMGLTPTHIESCVWFTHAPARRDLPASIEWAPWQVLDSYQLQGDVAQAVRNVLSSGREHVAKAGRRWPPMVGPAAATAEKVASLLRPTLETRVRPSDQRRAREQELAELLDEQVEALELVADNPRILITGPAGCGKTFLGLEAARRESATGKTGLLLCFNNALASQLALDAADIEGLQVHTLPGLMLEIAEMTAPETEAPGQFWEDDIAQSAWDALADDDHRPRADYLIVDEAQDLCRPIWLDVMDLLVDGGLASGRCLFLGDFNDQAIYSEGGEQRLRERIPDLSLGRQRTNCRNVPEIAQAACLLASVHDSYGRVRRSASGHTPQRDSPSARARNNSNIW